MKYEPGTATEIGDPTRPAVPADVLPDGRLTDEAVRALAMACAAPSDRKRTALRRWLIYKEKHKGLVFERLDNTLLEDVYREQVKRFVDVTDNVALDVVRSTSVVWPAHHRTVADAAAPAMAAFHKLVAESMLDVRALTWNRIAELVGPVIVAPAIRRGRLRWDAVYAHAYETIDDPEDPEGKPLAVAWPSARRSGKVSQVVVLDGQQWTHVDVGPSGATILPERRPHGLGFCPVATLRFGEEAGGDDDCSRNQRLEDATIYVGTVRSQMALMRKAQNGHLLVAIGFLGDAAKQQPIDPEMGVAINVDVGAGKQPPTVTTVDFNTSPENFYSDINGTKRAVAGAYGGTVDEHGRIIFDVDALTEIRKEQIPPARAFEVELWYAAVSMCQKLRHPLGADLPSPAQIETSLAVDFGKLSRTFADPAQEAAHNDWLLSKGSIDQIDILRAQGNQNLDDEQLKKKLEANLENQAWFNDAVTTRNLGMNGSDVVTAAEANGALGPAVRDGTPITVQVSGDPIAAEAGSETVDTTETAANEEPAEVAAAEPTTDVQAEALNGAQNASFVALCDKIATRQLPLELVARFLPIAFPGAVPNVEAARELLSPLVGFVPQTLNSTPDGGTASSDDEPEDDDADRER